MSWPAAAWQPITRPPSRLRVCCSTCLASAINESRALRGWTIATDGTKRYRCPACADVATIPRGESQ